MCTWVASNQDDIEVCWCYSISLSSSPTSTDQIHTTKRALQWQIISPLIELWLLKVHVYCFLNQIHISSWLCSLSNVEKIMKVEDIVQSFIKHLSSTVFILRSSSNYASIKHRHPNKGLKWITPAFLGPTPMCTIIVWAFSMTHMLDCEGGMIEANFVPELFKITLFVMHNFHVCWGAHGTVLPMY